MKLERIQAAKPSLIAYLPFLLLAAAIPLLLLLPVTHDAIWQMWLGRKMIGGAVLYRDVIEVNPPLWFWIAEPLAALNADPRLTVIGFFIAVTTLSLYLTPEPYRLPSLAVLLLVPLHDFGQREHFTLIAVVPYVFAVAARCRGSEPRHPIMVGFLAAVGLCLKPHFLLVPVALELLLHGKRHIRPETVALAIGGLTYAAAIPIFAPSYLSEQLPMNLRFYGDFAQARHYSIVVAAFGLAALAALWGRRRGASNSRALLVAAVAFLPAFFIQDKGFPYHSVPARGFLALAIAAEFMRERKNPLADSLLIGALALCCIPLGVYTNRYRQQAEQHLSGIDKGTSAAFIVTNPSLAWPMVEQHGLDWQLHGFSVWQLDAAVAHPALIPKVRRMYAADLAERPELLVLDNRPMFANAALAILPPHYLDCYRLRLTTASMRSYWRIC